jgi:hypothetical protein
MCSSMSHRRRAARLQRWTTLPALSIREDTQVQ